MNIVNYIAVTLRSGIVNVTEGDFFLFPYTICIIYTF